MRSVDTAVIAALEGAGLTVHEGKAPTTSDPNTIVSSLPFIVYRSGVGYEDEERMSLAGPTSTRSVPFRLTLAGLTPEQVKWAFEIAHAALSGRMIGGERVTFSDAQRDVLPDDSAKMSDGRNLYYAVVDYLRGGVVA